MLRQTITILAMAAFTVSTVSAQQVATAAAAAPEAPKYNIGGNIVQGYTFNPSNPADGYNGTVTWTDRANEYQLNQAWTYFEVPTDTSKKDFDMGGRVDLEYGSNYRWATSAGFEDKLFKTNTGANNNCTAAVTGTAGTAANNSNCQSTSSEYGLAMTQAYYDIAYKSVKLRMGHIISPVGYYTVDTSQNFFSVIPYTYQYGEPFTHWGAWLYYTPSDKLTLSGGVTHGGDNLTGYGTGAKLPGFLGTVSYVFNDKSTIDWVVHVSKEYNGEQGANYGNQSIVAGSYNGDPNLYSWRYFQTLVYKRDLTSRLEFVAQSDLGIQQYADPRAGVTIPTGAKVTATWFGANTYYYYRIIDSLKFGLNLEWFQDTAGVRVGSALPTSSAAQTVTSGVGTGATPSRSGYRGNFFQVTFGPKWQVQKNTFLRLMGRYDYFAGTAINGAGSLPFNNGSSRSQMIVGVDMGIVF